MRWPDLRRGIAVLGLLVACTGAPPSGATSAGGVRSAARGADSAAVRPIVAVLAADWCPACMAIKPAIAAVRAEYGDRVDFLDLDLTSDASAQQARTLAERRGLRDFFARYGHRTAIVGVFGRNGDPVEILLGESEAERYRRAIDAALATKEDERRPL